MRIGAGTHSRIADGRCIKREQTVCSQAQIIECRQLHDEVMRMLSVIDWLAKSRFSLLKKQRIEAIGDSCRLQAEHGAESKLASPDLALRHGHKPIGGKHFVIAARIALL